MEAFIVNCKPGNWEICNKYTIFGLKDANSFPPVSKGDLILLRISGPNYGLKALWYYEYAKKVVNQKNIKLSDDNYAWILNCKKICTLTKRFSEEFETSSKKSSKIADLYAGGIQKTVVSIKKPQLRDYIFYILKEFEDELDVTTSYLGEEVNVTELLQKILKEIIAIEPFPEPEKNEIFKPVSRQKEKTEKSISNLNEKSEKPIIEKRDKADKRNSERKIKSVRNGIELEESEFELVLNQEEKPDEPVQELKEKPNNLSPEKNEKADKQIPEQKVKPDISEKEIKAEVKEPVLNPEEEPDEPGPGMNEEPEIISIDERENSENQIIEHNEETDEAEAEFEEKPAESFLEKKTNPEESILEPEEEVMEPENKAALKISRSHEFEQVGERINLPILSYAPLNEKGILLLFGHYMKKLGFSHVEEIRTGFPDVVAIRSIEKGKYQRVRVGFEFNSSSFLEKGYEVNECDLIVCWSHDWENCPIEVIELSKALSGKGNS